MLPDTLPQIKLDDFVFRPAAQSGSATAAPPTSILGGPCERITTPDGFTRHDLRCEAAHADDVTKFCWPCFARLVRDRRDGLGLYDGMTEEGREVVALAASGADGLARFGPWFEPTAEDMRELREFLAAGGVEEKGDGFLGEDERDLLALSQDAFLWANENLDPGPIEEGI